MKPRTAPTLAIVILLMGGMGCLLTAASDNVVAQVRVYLAVAGPLQIALAAALLAHRDWAVPLRLVTFACQVTAIVTLTLTLLVTVGLGGDLLGYRGNGAVEPLAVASAMVTMLVVAAVYGLAVRSINRPSNFPTRRWVATRERAVAGDGADRRTCHCLQPGAGGQPVAGRLVAWTDRQAHACATLVAAAQIGAAIEPTAEHQSHLLAGSLAGCGRPAGGNR